MAFEQGWEPDPAVVDAVLDGRATLDTLEDADRAVVVAELSERGESVEQIADRLGCCTRVVKRLRADPLTRTLVRAMRAETARHQAETARHHTRTVSTSEAAELARRNDRLTQQLDALINSTARLRAQLTAAQTGHPAPVTMWVNRRKPGPRQAEQLGPPLFDLNTSPVTGTP